MTAGEVIRHRNDQGEANGDKGRGREGQICPQGIGTPGTGEWRGTFAGPAEGHSPVWSAG